jgi:hypothetical protein
MQLLEIAQVADEHVSSKPFFVLQICIFTIFVLGSNYGIFFTSGDASSWCIFMPLISHLDYPESHLTTSSLFLVWNAGQRVQVNNQVQDLQYKQYVWF